MTAQGSIVPLGSFELALRHLAVLSLGVRARPARARARLGARLASGGPTIRRAHGFALLTACSSLGMAVQVGSFAVRFGGSVVRDRYLFYVVAAPPRGDGRLPRPGAGAARRAASLGGLVFAVGIGMQGPTFHYEGLFADSPSSVSFLWFWRIFHPLGGVRIAYLVAAARPPARDRDRAAARARPARRAGDRGGAHRRVAR